MHIAMIGGSNSVIRDGYVKFFQQHLVKLIGEVEITNLSVGGTTSLTSIARLSEVKKPIDLIVFEYSLNDTGHLNHRSDGKEKKEFFLKIVFAYFKQKHPNARILPLILPSQPFYDLGVQNNVYDAELSFYDSFGINYLDMRICFPEIFGEVPPDFLYSDISHFHRGITCAMIGKLLAENARWCLTAQRPLCEIVQQDITLSNGLTVRPTYYSAAAIAESTVTPYRNVDIENSHLHVNCIRIDVDTIVSIPSKGWPVAVYIASDNSHSPLAIRINGDDILFSTRYQDILDGKFIFSSVPLILHDKYQPEFHNENPETILTLGKTAPVDFNFDCFTEASTSDGNNHAMLAGVLMLEHV